MGINILTSLFVGSFPKEFADEIKKIITQRNKFAFVASDFEACQKTDRYCRIFLDMFEECGIHFNESCVVDSRMDKAGSQLAIKNADVIWLAGGDTPTQFGYLEQYGLVDVLRQRSGVTIGMSAGSINMAKTAVCTLTCEHDRQQIYPALGLTDISVEPHLDKNNISEELLELSHTYSIYGICDDGAIICHDGRMTFIGGVFLINDGVVRKMENSEI